MSAHSATPSTTVTAVRAEADRLAAAGCGARFQRRRAPHSRRSDAVVLEAVTRARDGDQEAIRLLYLRFADAVYGHVCSILRDEHEAEDVTQTIFAKLPAALGRYEPRVAPFSAWIQRVAHNAALDCLRARRAVPSERIDSPDPADAVVARQRSADLKAAIAGLPVAQREVILLRLVLGLSPGEIVERTGSTLDAVHGLQHRGRVALRRELTALRWAPTTRRLSGAAA